MPHANSIASLRSCDVSVVFIDTSVLCAFLRIPGKDDRRDEIMEEFRRRQAAGDDFVLPITTIIETGNHIEQLPEGLGAERRRCAESLAEIVRRIAGGEAPWVLHQVTWDDKLLTRFCDGGPK